MIIDPGNKKLIEKIRKAAQIKKMSVNEFISWALENSSDNILSNSVKSNTDIKVIFP